jgi:hypothetical protein
MDAATEVHVSIDGWSCLPCASQRRDASAKKIVQKRKTNVMLASKMKQRGKKSKSADTECPGAKNTTRENPSEISKIEKQTANAPF